MNYFFGLEYNKENNRIMSFLWFIIIGIVAGYVAGKIMRGGGFGLIVNLVVGIIGGVLGGLVVQSAGYLFDRWDYRQSGCGYDRGDRFAMDCVSFQRTEA